MKLLLIRHTSVAIPSGICYGQSDVPVAETFASEAASVKAELSKHKIGIAYTSPLSRCVKLANECGFPDAVKDSRLMEMNFGTWEMQRYDEISDPRIQLWYNDYINTKATSGESFMDQQTRFKSFINSLPKGHDTIAVFTHAGIIMQAMILLQGRTLQQAFSAQPSYGSILEIDTSNYQSPT